MNDWKEFSGKPPIALSELPNGTPRFYEGAWYLRQGGVLHHAPVAVGMGRAMSSTGRLDLQTAAMNRALAGVGFGATTTLTTAETTTAKAMADALAAHGYKMSDMSIYKAFQAAEGMTADGYPGTTTMTNLQQVLFAMGEDMPNVPIYPWKSTGGYNGVNAPLMSQWDPSGSGGTTIIIPPPGVIPGKTTTTTTTSTTTNVEPWLVGAAVLAGAGLIGMAVLHKPTRGKVSRHVGHARRHVFGSERHMRTFVKRHA